MKRRVVLTLCLLGIVGGTAGGALAAEPTATTQSNNHAVCVMLASNEDYKHPQYICVDTP